MVHIRLTEAAKLTGKDKATIHRALKSGRLSFTLGHDGERQIDPAELERVFPIKPEDEQVTVARRNPKKHQSNYTQLAQLSAMLEVEKGRTTSLQERLTDKDAVIEDLRERLDQEAEERRRTQAQLTALLTDQREKSKPESEQAASPAPAKRRWRLFGRG